MAEATCLRVSDILEYAEFKEEFANQIGKYNVKKLNAIKDLYLYDFGIFVEVAPDEEEKAQLEQNIQVALSTGGIDLDDAIDIREIKNVKLANQLLKVKRSKKAEKDRMYSMQQQQQQAANQMKSQEVAAQLSIQKTQVESQTKMQEQQAKIAFEIEKMKSEAQLKTQLMDLEFRYNMALKGIDASSLKEREEMKELSLIHI